MTPTVDTGLIARWAHLYADHAQLSAAIMFAHLSGVLVAGGLALAADRASLALEAGSGSLVAEIARLKTVHAWVIGGLALTVATGGLQLLSDLHTYLTSWLFWTKMGLIAVLLLNGWVRLRAERGIESGDVEPHFRRFRRTSLASVMLWFAVLLAGSFLTTVS